MIMLKQCVEGHIHLTGSRVQLRSFTCDNLNDKYLGWLQNFELMQFSNQRFLKHSFESCRAYFASFLNTENLFLAIYHEDNFIGTMTAYRSFEHSTADIGLLISSEVHGKGLGKDAWATLMAHLLSTGTRKVTGGTVRCNVAMVKIMEGCGMQSDGVRVGQELIKGEAQDILHFAKFAQL